MSDKSNNPWVILEHESWMLEGSIQEKERLGRSIHDAERVQVLNNALTESAVLHARALCELLSNPEGKFPASIELSHLLPDWDWGKPKYDLLNSLLSELEEKYGQLQNSKSPCRAFDMMLTHAAAARCSERECAAALDSVLPLIRLILAEIWSKRPYRESVET